MSAAPAAAASEVVIPEFHPRQAEACQALMKHQFVLFGGARGGGKSHWLRWWLFLQLLALRETLKNVVVGLFCEDYPALTDRQVGPISREFPRVLGQVRTDQSRGFGWHLHDGTASILLRNLDDGSKYQSAQFAAVAIDELTKVEKSTFDLLRGSLRWPGVPRPRFVATANPGGIGHQWVRQLWIDRVFPPEMMTQAHEFAFVKSLPSDNPSLDPAYWHMLETLPPVLARAWRHGDWDAFSGQMFAFYEPIHVIEAHDPPAGAQVLMTFDWGFGAPYSVGWWYVASDKRLVRFCELYGAQPGDDTIGLRQSDDEVAERVLTIERDRRIPAPMLRLAGGDCFARKPDSVHGGQSPSTAETWARHGLILSPGDTRPGSRSAKLREFHRRLAYPKDAAGNAMGLPGLQVTQDCRAFARLIPAMTPDENNPDDVDTRGPDHVYDEACHAVMCRAGEVTAGTVETMRGAGQWGEER